MTTDDSDNPASTSHYLRRSILTTFRLVRQYSAIFFLVVGSLLVYVLASIQFWSVIGPISGVTLGSLVAAGGLLIHRFSSHTKTPDLAEPDPTDIRIAIILACLYPAAIIVLFRFYTYQRPLLLYILFGGFAGLIGYQIARGASSGSIVLQIFSLSFFTYWSSQFIFPAGIAGPDTTAGYIPSINQIFISGNIPQDQTIYAGHLAYAAEFSIVSGLSAQTGYFLLATLLLVLTILIISNLNRIFPAIPQRMSLYAALIFSVSSWMLGRGMHPNKLNFFYALILLLGASGILLYRLTRISLARRTLIGLIIMPAIIFGHQFSAGAALFFLSVIGVFAIVTRWFTPKEYGPESLGGPVSLFVFIYFLGVIGNPIHQEPLLGRLSGLLLSVVQTTESAAVTGGAGGPGRYSELAINVLIASTAAQTLLFTVVTIGAIWLFRQAKWEYDFLIAWMGAISLLLIVSLLTNSVDTAPQRFYGLLLLIGFNICVGALLYVIDRRGTLETKRFIFHSGRSVVVILLVVLAVTSLASPVADKATSPVAEDLPHVIQFNTHQLVESNQWSATYTENPERMVPRSSTVPIEQTGEKTGRADRVRLRSGTVAVYSSLSNRTGLISGQGLSLGGRRVVFVPSPIQHRDDRIYSNGETEVFIIYN